MPSSKGDTPVKKPALEQASKSPQNALRDTAVRSSVSFLVGLLFAVGLAISGMTHPSKVIGFLDFFGDWDPDLTFVMGGAVVSFYLLRRLTGQVKSPLLGREFHLPTKDALDAPLILGALSFGVGWGLLGFCPGPALTSLVTFEPQTLLFIGAMVGGMFGHTVWSRLRAPARR